MNVPSGYDAKKELIALFGAKDVFDTPRHERHLERALELPAQPGDLALDSFLGSGRLPPP